MKFKINSQKYVGSLKGPEITPRQYRKLQNILGEAMGTPVYDPPENREPKWKWPANPHKFFLIITEKGLECIYFRHIRKNTGDKVFAVSTPKKGRTVAEWDDFTLAAICRISEAPDAVREFFLEKLGMLNRITP